jgi:hypothetical protein
MKRAIVLAVFLAVFSAALMASGSAFLSEGIGAGANSAGGAMTAGIQGVDAMYWNPAGLAYMGACSWQMSAGYNVLSQDRIHAYTGAAFHSDDAGYIGVLVNHFGSGKINLYDDGGNPVGEASDLQFAGGLTYANFLGNNLACGATVRYVQQDLAGYRASGFGADIGLVYQPFLSAEFFLGAMAQNIVGSLSWPSGSEDMFGRYSAGASWTLFEGVFTVCGDWVQDEGSAGYYRAGCQAVILNTLMLRGGINNGDLAAGFGFVYGPVRIDYAYLFDRYDTGDIHEVSLILTW